MRQNDLVPTTVRTKIQSVGTGGSVLDLSFLDAKDSVVSVNVIPPTPDSLEIQGIQGDDGVIIADEGETFFIAFRPSRPSELPFLVSVAGTINVVIKVATERR